MELREPDDLILIDTKGKERKFILSKFPAVLGREIAAKYPMSALPKVGDYNLNEETMLKLMAYVAIDLNGNPMRLSTRDLVDNHVEDSEMLMRIEVAMMGKNYTFFRNGSLLSFLDGITQRFLQKISEISILLSQQSSQVEKQRSTNSEPSTP